MPHVAALVLLNGGWLLVIVAWSRCRRRSCRRRIRIGGEAARWDSVLVIPSGHQPATASRELIVNKQRRTCSKNIERSRDGLSVTSFGTRGSQVQILPLRPTLSAISVLLASSERVQLLVSTIGASEVASTLNTHARSPRISSCLAPSRPTSNSTAASPPMAWPITVAAWGRGSSLTYPDARTSSSGDAVVMVYSAPGRDPFYRSANRQHRQIRRHLRYCPA